MMLHCTGDGAHQLEATLLWFLDDRVEDDGIDGFVREDSIEGSLEEDDLKGHVEEDEVHEDEETLVMKEMGLTDVDQMYSKLDMFMSGKIGSLILSLFPI